MLLTTVVAQNLFQGLLQKVIISKHRPGAQVKNGHLNKEREFRGRESSVVVGRGRPFFSHSFAFRNRVDPIFTKQKFVLEDNTWNKQCYFCSFLNTIDLPNRVSKDASITQFNTSVLSVDEQVVVFIHLNGDGLARSLGIGVVVVGGTNGGHEVFD